MTRLPDKIPIEPLGEARWERIERALLERRAEQKPAPRPRRLWIPAAALALAAAAGLWFLIPREPAPQAPVATTAQSAHVSFDGAELTIHPDSVVSFREHEVVLESGGVDCVVAPRKAPFRVVAGDVTVSVVGTRFTVERRGQVRVTVTEGKVAVARGAEERLLTAGQSWDETPPAPDAAVAIVTAAPDAGPDPREVAAAEARAREKLIREADDLRPQHPEDAIERYRKLSRGSDRIAARALYDVAYISLFRLRKPAEAVTASKLYERRFPRGVEAADALWVRFEAYLDLNQVDAARAAATEYVQRYPKGDKLERALVIANR